MKNRRMDAAGSGLLACQHQEKRALRFIEPTMNIIRSEHLGMCFGVRDAISLAVKLSELKPLTILGDLVHNETVLATLQAKGITIEQEASKVNTPMVLVTAHGASERALQRTRALGLNVLE